MRKCVFVVVTLLLATFLATGGYSQVAFTKGVKFGLNMANFSGSDVSNTSNRTAFKVGAFGIFDLGGLVSLQPEVLYTMKGASEKIDVLGTTVKVTYKLAYLEIPVLVRLNLPLQGSTLLPGFFAGPAMAFKLSGKVKAEGGGSTEETDMENVKSTDWGLVFGFGLNVGPIYVDVRYNMGLSTIDDSADPSDIKNRVISFNVGFAR